MKRLLSLLALLFPLISTAATYPNYFVTNASPFDVVPGVSVYVPTLYSTNMVTTNLTVTDFLFIGTAQVNYLTMLGSINQQGVGYTNYFMAETNYFPGSLFASNIFGDISGVTGTLPSSLIPTLDQVAPAGDPSTNTQNIATWGNYYGNIKNTTNDNSNTPLFSFENGGFFQIDGNVWLGDASSPPQNDNNGTYAISTTYNLDSSFNEWITNYGGMACLDFEDAQTNVTLDIHPGAMVIGYPPSGTTNSFSKELFVYGNITATGTNTAAAFVGNNYYGNIENATNSNANTPVFNDFLNPGNILGINIGAPNITDSDVDYNYFVPSSGSILSAYIESSGTNFPGDPQGNLNGAASYGSIVALYITSSTNINVLADQGSVAAIQIGNKTNIDITAQYGSGIFGQPPSNTTNVVNDGVKIFGNITATGTNTATQFVSTASRVTNYIYSVDAAGTGRVTNTIVLSGGLIALWTNVYIAP